MSTIDRFQRAFESQFGFLFLLLVGLVLLLGLVLVVLKWRQRRRDLLAYHYSAFYERAIRIARGLTFSSQHQAEFFGRQTVVQLPKGPRGLCLIPPPELVDSRVGDRFLSYHRAIAEQKLPLFAKTLWKHGSSNCLIIVQNGLLHQNGRPLLHINHFLQDKRLSKAYVEQILLAIAKALASLHGLRTESGASLFHGFLLPRAICIDFDTNRTLDSIVIADAGLVYSFGAEKTFQRLKALRRGKLPMDRFCIQELVEQLPMLAPEVKEGSSLDKVGPPADFFSFAALAAMLFTQRRFVDHRTVEWGQIPGQWQPFLKASLAEDPVRRPVDFLELIDWLEEPELALTQRVGRQNALDEEESTAAEGEVTLTSLSELLRQVQARHAPQAMSASSLSASQQTKLASLLENGFKAIKQGKWEIAREQFAQVVKLMPSHAEALAQLAIAHYELGNLDQAQRDYEAAKTLNPQVADCFHEHIAFRV